MPMHSSSLQTRTRRSAGSLAIGRKRPALVTISGTESTHATPLALMAAMMLEPCSSTLAASALVAVWASMEPPVGAHLWHQCRRFEVPTAVAENSFRNFQSKSGTGAIELPVPLCFRSSCQRLLRGNTNFGSGALVEAYSL